MRAFYGDATAASQPRGHDVWAAFAVKCYRCRNETTSPPPTRPQRHAASLAVPPARRDARAATRRRAPDRAPRARSAWWGGRPGAGDLSGGPRDGRADREGWRRAARTAFVFFSPPCQGVSMPDSTPRELRPGKDEPGRALIAGPGRISPILFVEPCSPTMLGPFRS